MNNNFSSLKINKDLAKESKESIDHKDIRNKLSELARRNSISGKLKEFLGKNDSNKAKLTEQFILNLNKKIIKLKEANSQNKKAIYENKKIIRLIKVECESNFEKNNNINDNDNEIKIEIKNENIKNNENIFSKGFDFNNKSIIASEDWNNLKKNNLEKSIEIKDQAKDSNYFDKKKSVRDLNKPEYALKNESNPKEINLIQKSFEDFDLEAQDKNILKEFKEINKSEKNINLLSQQELELQLKKIIEDNNINNQNNDNNQKRFLEGIDINEIVEDLAVLNIINNSDEGKKNCKKRIKAFIALTTAGIILSSSIYTLAGHK